MQLDEVATAQARIQAELERTLCRSSKTFTPRAMSTCTSRGLDTSTPSRRAMFHMLGVFTEFERAMIRERVMAGLARAKAEGTRLGQPATIADDAAKVQTIRLRRGAKAPRA